MAVVYLARNVSLERPCAIKVLQAKGQGLDALLAEARAAASLVHPHVVAIHALEQFRGRHFIEMEFVDGPSLALAVDEAGSLAPLDATRIMLQISSALALAHDQRLIHRDVKPANVMLQRGKEAKLADFGLAKRVAGSSARREACGTPHYMAPELFAGRPANECTDIYAMGVSFFELLTGERPIECESLGELISVHSRSDGVDLGSALESLPAELAQIIQCCLQKEAARRFQHAGELGEALRSAFGALRSLGDLLQEAFAGTEIDCRGAGDEYVAQVFREGRSQTVHIQLQSSPELAEHLVRIYSPCGPLDATHYEQALLLNARCPYGAIGIETVDGCPYFVMADSYPRSTCDAEEVRRSVICIAEHADEVERLLTGADKH